MKPGILYQLMSAFGGHKQWQPRSFEPSPDAGPREDGQAWLAGLLDREGPTCPLAYSEELKAKVWHKALPIIGWDPNEWRVDHAGNPLFRPFYGDCTSSFGWEIGWIDERTKGADDDITLLRPQQCRDYEAQPADQADRSWG